MTGGDSDFALITDFNPNRDTINLASFADDFANQYEVSYKLAEAPEGFPAGTGIYIDQLNPLEGFGDSSDAAISKPNELIAVLQAVTPASLSLSESYFNFTA